MQAQNCFFLFFLPIKLPMQKQPKIPLLPAQITPDKPKNAFFSTFSMLKPLASAKNIRTKTPKNRGLKGHIRIAVCEEYF